MYKRLLLLIIFGASAAGCGGEGGPPDNGAVVELGTGTVDYETLTPGQDLPLIQGPQGGHHFHLHARIKGMTPGDALVPNHPQNPTTTFNVFTEDGDLIDFMASSYRLGYQPGGDGFDELLSGRIVQVVESRISELIGHEVVLRVQVEDVDGLTATDEVRVKAFEVPLLGARAGQ